MYARTVNISFQSSLLSDIDRVAQAESRSRSELLREAARMYIERKKRWDRIFSDGRRRAMQRGLTEEDVELEIRRHRQQKAGKQ